MKNFLKILLVVSYSFTILVCSEEHTKVSMKIGRRYTPDSDGMVDIYALGFIKMLHYRVRIRKDNIMYSIYQALINLDTKRVEDGKILYMASRYPKLEDLYKIQDLVDMVMIDDKGMIDADFFIKKSRISSDKETKNLFNIFDLYKTLCVYAPTQYGYLDNLLAPLPKQEQDEIKVLNRQMSEFRVRELEVIESAKSPKSSYDLFKRNLAQKYNTMLQYLQSWKRPQLKKEHIFGLAGLGVGLGIGAYYLYKYPRQQAHIQ